MMKVILTPEQEYAFEVSETTHLLSETRKKVDNEEQTGRNIGLFSSISMTLTIMTGVGIFIFPNMVLKEIHSGGGALVLWAFGGTMSLLAGICYAELALAIPGSGGDFNYLSAAYGPSIANLFLLTAAFVKYPAVTVILSRSCVEYFKDSIGITGESYGTLHISIIGVIVLAAIITLFSTRTTTALVNALNSFKLVGLGSIIIMAVIITVKDPNKAEIVSRLSFNGSNTDPRSVVVGLFGSMASYEGWNTLNMVAGEIIYPHRTIPIGISVATSITTFLYVVCNVAYLAVLPTKAVIQSDAVALDFGRVAFGKIGEVFLTICVVFSAAAGVLALSICNSRLIQKASTQGQLPEMFSLVHKKFKTPIFGVLLHAFISIIFSFIDSISSLVIIIVLIAWFFYMLCFIALLIFRFRDRIIPDFTVPLPIPVFMILFSIVLLIAPGTTSGCYRLSFLGSAGMILACTPIAVIVGRNVLPENNILSHISKRITLAIKGRVHVE